MIKYNLLCTDCEITFDSWFASSKEYEKLKRKKLLVCHSCNSQKVKKSLMAPQLINSKKKQRETLDIAKYKDVKKQLKIIKNLLKKTLNM